MKRKKTDVRDGSKRERDPHKKIFASLRESEILSRTDIERAVALSLQSLRESKAIRAKELVAASLGMAGKCYLIQGDRPRASEHFKLAAKLYESLGDIDAELEMQHGLASAKLTTGNEKNTLVHLHQILHGRIHSTIETLSAASKDKFFIPRTWEDRVLGRIPSTTEMETNQRIQLGAIYDSLGFAYIVIREHHKAASFLEEELVIYRSLNDRTRLANAVNNLGYVHGLLGNNVMALEYSQQGLKLSRQLHDKRGIAINERNLAQLYLNTGQVALGKRLAMRSFETAHTLGMWELASRALVTLTRYERLHGSLTKASAFVEKGLELWKDKDKGGPYLFFYFQKLLIENARQHSRAVYTKLLRLHKVTKEKGLELQHEVAQEIARAAEELQLLPDTLRWFKKVHAYEIERLNSEQRNALVSLQTEQELDRLAKERELEKLAMDKLEMELDARARETKLLAVHLAKKGSFLATLTDQLAIMKSTNPQFSAQTIDAVVQLIESIRFKDKEYENLEERAESLHRDFIVALVERYPALTATEKRICVLLRLGLGSIDIANVLFTSVRTVETHSLSIRKKLRIPSSTRLSKFLLDFEPAIARALVASK
jgi:DNA-binding CsgD family transcriptional regulator/tetratricopeptide (TPR) repeat protein